MPESVVAAEPPTDGCYSTRISLALLQVGALALLAAPVAGTPQRLQAVTYVAEADALPAPSGIQELRRVCFHEFCFVVFLLLVFFFFFAAGAAGRGSIPIA